LMMQSYCFVFKNTRKNKPFQTILELSKEFAGFPENY